jgi:hypothetical protein
VVDVDFDVVFTRLVDGKACVFRPVPEPAPLEYSGEKPEARQHAQRIGIQVSVELPVPGHGLAAHPNSGQALRALCYPEDLERTLRRMARDANTAIEETGTNMLYLVFGFLEFYEVAHADQPLNAPLVALPVSLARKKVDPSTGYYEYEIIHNGEDYSENVTLREKLKQEFAFPLPELQEDDTAESYLHQVAGLVETRPGWRLKRQVTLGFLSFGKLAIWADLDPSRRQTFLHHPQVKTILTGTTHDVSEEPDEHRVDEHATLDSLVYDADTSQHRALIDVLDGANIVINGPPGTGKSQTITNIIAVAMARGQSVLFVSEKLAALEVVKSRLDKTGLGPILFT